MNEIAALAIYVFLGVLGSAAYVVNLKLWDERLEIYRRLFLGGVGGFIVFLLVLGKLIEMILSGIASIFGGYILVQVDSPVGFILAFFLGGYWGVDFISALANKFKPLGVWLHVQGSSSVETLPIASISLTPEQQLKEVEKGTEIGQMLLNAQRRLMAYEYEEKGIKTYNLSDEVVLNTLRERVKAGKEEKIHIIR